MPTTTDTKDQILNAAEELFAAQGHAGTSLRAITALAKANLAAVHYHFGSKEELTKAVFGRRIAPINAERIRRLDALEREAGAEGPALEPVLRAFIEPILEFGRQGEGAAFRRLMGRLYAEAPDFLREAMREQFGGILRRFSAAFGRRLPHLQAADLIWRFHFTVGAMAHTMCYGHDIAAMSGGQCDPEDAERVTDQLVAFAKAGLEAGGSET